jgi:hypothetical protein
VLGAIVAPPDDAAAAAVLSGMAIPRRTMLRISAIVPACDDISHPVARDPRRTARRILIVLLLEQRLPGKRLTVFVVHIAVALMPGAGRRNRAVVDISQDR